MAETPSSPGAPDRRGGPPSYGQSPVAGPASGTRSQRGLTQTPEVHSGAEYSVMMSDSLLGDEDGNWYGSEPPPPDEDPLVGTCLSNTYDVVRILGEGGMGRVYEAQHTRIKSKRFAVKALHPEFARRKDVLARFQREVEAAASISSPHVVGVYDVGETDDGRPYLVSELLTGEELGEYLDKVGMMSIGPAVRVVRQVCKALAAAHDVGVVHRDVKPENVFLTGDITHPVAKVLDFGISRLEGQGGNTLTKTGMVMGTPSYMAPEQARGMKVDHRTDIYATGAILYRALTGKLPFDRSDATATLAAVLTEEPERPRALAPHIPEALELVIQRAMAREPDERYQSMDELDDALAPFDEDQALAPAAGGAARPRLPSQSATLVGNTESEVRAARPQVAFLLALAIGGSLLALVGVAAAVIRLIRGGEAPTITGTEAVVIGLVVVAAVATPVIMLLRHVAKSLWDNTAKVLELLSALREPVVVALAASGMFAIVMRVLESVVWRSPTGAAWAVWDLLVPVVGVSAGLTSVQLRRSRPVRRGAGLGGTVLAIAGASLMLGMVITLSAVRGSEPGAEWDVGPETTGSAATDYAGEPPAAPQPVAPTASVTGVPPPKVEHIWSELYRQTNRKNWAGALALLEQLIAQDPNAGEDSDVRKAVMKIAVGTYYAGGERAERMTQLLTDKMGKSGPDILFELTVTRGGSKASSYAETLLKNEQVRARGSVGMQIAYQLRKAKSCDDVRPLIGRAAKEGDYRTLRELVILQSCRGGRCCLRDDDELKAAIEAIEARR